MRHEDDVSIMVSEGRDFGERTIRGEVRRVDVSNRQQTNYYGHQAPVGRGGGDRAVVVQGPGRTRDSGTALWELRHEEDELQHERKKLLPLGWDRFRVRRDQGTGYGTEHLRLLTRRQAASQGGVDPRPVALVRETDRNKNGAARSMRG